MLWTRRTLVPLVLSGMLGMAMIAPAGAVSPGTQLWASRFKGPTYDTARSIATSPDGRRVYVTGISEVPRTDRQQHDAVTVAYDAANGGELWVARYHVAPAGFAYGFKVIADPTGSVVYVGITSSVNGTSTSHVIVEAYDAVTGQAQWAADTPGYAGTTMVLSADARSLIVAGDRADGVANGVMTQRISTQTGASEWISTGDPTSRISGLSFVPNLDLIVETWTLQRPTSGYDTIAVALDADGVTLWSTPVAAATGAPSFIASASDGSAVFVTAGDDTAGAGLDYLTYALDPASGAVRWSARFSGPRRLDQVFGITASHGGSRVFITGTSNQDYTTVAYRGASGRRLWVASYDGAGMTDRAFAIGLSPSGSKVFVTGNSPTPGEQGGFATVAYSAADGAQLWAARYDTAFGHVGATDLAVSPVNSHVFVMGTGSGDGTLYDYVTLAYAP